MSATPSITLIPADDYQAESEGRLVLANDAEVLQLALAGIFIIELQFPVYTDGRAFSQAQLLRRRRGFAGTLRATGDVLIDQLLQMQRCGFDQAVLRADQDAAHGTRLLALFTDGYYQGDVQQPDPRFVNRASATAKAGNADPIANADHSSAGARP